MTTASMGRHSNRGSAARIATAPVSWGVCEVPGWGHQMSAIRVLGEMRALGLPATEAGPDGFLPADPAALRGTLGQHGLSLVGGFTPLVLHRGGGWRDGLRRQVRRLAACGGEVVVLAAVTGLDGYDERPGISAAEWRTLLAALGEAAGIAAGSGLTLVLHPHVGTVVERPGEIDRVLGGSAVPLCLDTGHIMAGGGDPAAIARVAPDRIGHVHVKDVRGDLAAQVAAGTLGYGAAVRAGLYCPPGDGDAGIAAIAGMLRDARYEGWYVLEQDVMLDAEPEPDAGPRRWVERGARYLRDLLAGGADG